MTRNIGASVTFPLKFHHCVEATFSNFESAGKREERLADPVF